MQGLVTAPRQRGESISQAEWGAESTVRARSAKGQKGRRSRKRQANLTVVHTLKCSERLGVRFYLHRQAASEAHEGNRLRKRRSRRGGELLRGRNTRRAAAFRSDSTRIGRWRILAESKALKATLPFYRAMGSPEARSAVANATRVTASGRARMLCEGEKP
jgi:hypothetical protein